MSRLFFREAIARAIAEEMDRDPRVILLGQDIAAHGGSYAETRGLFERRVSHEADRPTYSGPPSQEFMHRSIRARRIAANATDRTIPRGFPDMNSSTTFVL